MQVQTTIYCTMPTTRLLKSLQRAIGCQRIGQCPHTQCRNAVVIDAMWGVYVREVRGKRGKRGTRRGKRGKKDTTTVTCTYIRVFNVSVRPIAGANAIKP